MNLPCPLCRTVANVRRLSGGLFYCTRCKNQFDDDPDEGGTHYYDPTKWIEREERDERRGKVRRNLSKPGRQLRGGCGS